MVGEGDEGSSGDLCLALLSDYVGEASGSWKNPRLCASTTARPGYFTEEEIIDAWPYTAARLMSDQDMVYNSVKKYGSFGAHAIYFSGGSI